METEKEILKKYLCKEEEELVELIKTLRKLELKWFKTSGIKNEIEFLKIYIKNKEEMINKIKDEILDRQNENKKIK